MIDMFFEHPNLNEFFRSGSQVRDVIAVVKAGKRLCSPDNRWLFQVVNWSPLDGV